MQRIIPIAPPSRLSEAATAFRPAQVPKAGVDAIQPRPLGQLARRALACGNFKRSTAYA
jgi:hypothetical protein